MALRDHRAALRVDARIEHRVIDAEPFRRNADELQVAIAEEGETAG